MSRRAAALAKQLFAIGLGLFSATCNGAGSDHDGDVECGSIPAFRTDVGRCPVRAETGMRWCIPARDERHWGGSRTCATSPEGDLYVVSIPHGANVVDDTGWSVSRGDAGASEACLEAFQSLDGCDDW